MPSETDDARIEALRRARILDTREEGAFADLVGDMAAAFSVPMAGVGFLDRDRLWFKAVQGFSVRELPRAAAFCAHVLHADEPLVVRDARLDVRFARNPLVRGAPHLRFYAGARLLDQDGHALGTVCILDTRPHPEGMNRAERTLLRSFAERAAAHVELRLFRLEWLEQLPRVVLERAALADRAGAREKAQRLVSLAYAAAEMGQAP